MKKYYKESITAKDVVKLLNQMLKIDRQCVEKLIENRVPCTRKLAMHPTIQVIGKGDGTYRIGMMGIINGMFGIDDNGMGQIVAYYKSGILINFRTVKKKG